MGATARADVIVGTSAGGINGAFLAYAQAYDADLSWLGAKWAELGSFEKLLRDPREPGRGSFLRGDDYFLGKLADAFEELASGAGSGSYVRPDRRPVDLIINTTLMRGWSTPHVDDFGTAFEESSHGGELRLTRAADTPPSDDPFNDPEIIRRLALASRSTASFPVAFEPSFLPVGEDGNDVDHPDMAVATRLAVAAPLPQSRYVLDGGILLNQPVRPALASIYAQPADRQVRRLLMHVNPDPRSAIPGPIADLVGWGQADAHRADRADRADRPPRLAAVLATLAILPYAQSVEAELRQIQDTNDRVRRHRSGRPEVIGGLDEKLARRLMDQYRSVRSAEEAGRIDAALASAQARGRRWWTRAELATALRDADLDGIDVLPRALPDRGADPRRWAWGLGPVERVGAIAVDLFKRALWLAPHADPELRARVRGYRARLHAELATLREIRRVDEDFWRGWATRPPAPPAPPAPGAAGADAARRERLDTWLRAAMAAWPLPPETRNSRADRDLAGDDLAQNSAAHDGASRNDPARQTWNDPGRETMSARLGAAAEGIACLLIEAADDLWRLAAPAEYRTAATVPGAAVETELLAKLLRALLSDDLRTSPAALLHRLTAVEVCQLAIAGAPPDLEQEVIFQQVSGFTPNSFGGPVTPEKIAGIRLLWFGGFLRESWRVNDWIWGRLDGATRVVQAVLDPARLRQLGWSAEKATDALRRIAVGGMYADELGTTFDAERAKITAELAFLDAPDPGAPVGTLPATTQTVTRRLHAEILTEELPHLLDAFTRDRTGGAGGAPRPPDYLEDRPETQRRSLEALFASFVAASTDIVREPLADAIPAALVARATKVGLEQVADLATPSAGTLAAVLSAALPPQITWPVHLVTAPVRWSQKILGVFAPSIRDGGRLLALPMGTSDVAPTAPRPSAPGPSRPAGAESPSRKA